MLARGFPDALRLQVAELYDAAFGAKLAIAIPDTAARVPLLEASLDPEHAFVATRGSTVLGVVGFKTTSGALTSGITVARIREHLGTWRSIRALGVLSLYERSLSPEQLLLDGISVSPEARGAGIGTKLLKRIIRFAASESYRTIRLDVIDTNPGARRLYERLGFVATETTHFPFLKRLLGFSASTTLEYRVD